ncbi:hypothetical protein [Halobaculum litoreum]|uniref:Uncharacterized protein n=1 Tax=Halobaculum litoreum TaxID=3031998 RepID=A0ABD5XUX0_9EURY|nr:hypothetical protein [Halobaculum sp. DT92]
MEIEFEIDGQRRGPNAGDDPVVEGARIRVASDLATTAYRNIWQVSVDDLDDLQRRADAAWLWVTPPRSNGTDARVVAVPKRR